jgi:hypothetical protein
MINSKYTQLCLMFVTDMSSTNYVIQWYNSIQCVSVSQVQVIPIVAKLDAYNSANECVQV